MRDSTLTVIVIGALPAIIYSLAIYAYWGLVKKETLGYFGLSRGVLAIVYGVIYALFCIASLAAFGYSLWTLINGSFNKIIIDLLTPLPPTSTYPVVNLIFAALGLMTFIAGYGVIYYLRKRNSTYVTNIAHQSYIKRRFYVIGATFFAIGALLHPGMPQAVLVLMMVPPFYLEPAANPYKTLQFNSR